MAELRSYGKVYNLGHAAVQTLFDQPVYGEEKVDGSQFSAGRRGTDILFRSHRQQLYPDCGNKMFEPAIQTILSIGSSIPDGWTIRAEAVYQPRHNVLCYDRAPRGGLVVFDVDQGEEDYLSPLAKRQFCDDRGLECVPLLFSGTLGSMDGLDALLDSDSFLGGTKVEGVVFKAYGHFGRDGKTLMGKYVSEKFKEKHKRDWKGPVCQKDIKGELIDTYRTEARWAKAVAHLREDCELQQDPRDIGPLMKELSLDFEEECAEEIKESLWKWARNDIIRGVQRGFPEWYKRQLAESQFS